MLKNKFVIFLIGFYTFWLGVLPLILNNTVSNLCDFLSNKSKFSISIKTPRIILSVIPTVKIKAQSISFKTGNNHIQIEEPNINLRILPLLSGKIHINNFKSSKISTSVNLNKTLELDKHFFKKLDTTSITCDNIFINEFETLLYQKEISKPIKHSGKNLLFIRKNRYIKFQTKSFLEVGNKKSNSNWDLFIPKNNDINKTTFDVQLSNLDLPNLKTYLKNYLPKDLKELNGNINVHANKNKLILEMINCSAIMEDSAKSIILPKKLSISSIFNINKNFINFNLINIDSNELKIDGEGKIYNYLGKTKPTIEFNIRINPSKIENIVNLLPPFKVEELDAYKLKKYGLYGDLIANIKIKGRFPEPNINGDICINNVALNTHLRNKILGASVKVKLLGKNAEFEAKVPANAGEYVYVNGSQEIYNIKYADLDISSSNNVDLKIAQTVLNPLHEILNFIIGPVPIMEIKGTGNIDINVKGNRKNPHIRGILNIENTQANFKNMPNFIVKNLNAILTFNDQNVLFTNKSGLLNNKDVSINGTANLSGKFDFDIYSKEQPTKNLYLGLKTNKYITHLIENVPNIENINGIANFKIKVFGSIKNLQEIYFNQNVFAKGNIELINNSLTFNKVNMTNINGTAVFDEQNCNAIINAKTGDDNLKIKTHIKKDFADLNLEIPKLNPNFIIENETIRSKNYLPYISVIAQYKGKINKIDYEKLNLKAKVLHSDKNSFVNFENGDIVIQNNNIQINNLKGFIENDKNTMNINARINDAFTKQASLNGNISLKLPDLTLLNKIFISDLFTKDINNYIKNLKFNSGSADLNLKIINNKLNFFSELAGIKITYLPIDLPIEFVNGTIALKNDNLKLDKINLIADGMPVLIDGEIKDILNKQIFNIYLNSKPRQEFIDKYINKNQIYPIKVKGDIVYWAKLKGISNNLELSSKIDLGKRASIFHLGATVGDIENAITIYQESQIINKNTFKIKEFSYDKIIDSLNTKQTKLNLLKAWGNISLSKDNILLNNFHIKTSSPTDARIFNIIFRKPNIKQGLFTSDLKINGSLSNPKIIGDFHIFETEIPFFDTTAKNIEFNFKDKTIDIISKGDILGSDFDFNASLKNKITKPYIIESGSLHTKRLDLNRIINKLKISEIDNVSTFESFEDFELNSIIFNNFKIIADNIELRNIQATDVEALLKLDSNGIFNVNNFKFNIAQGSLNGNYRYNLKNNDIMLNLDINSIDANDITLAVFDLNNQIYGDMTGNFNLSCNGTNFQHCMQTLSGNSIFNVKDGRIPKLGSLEYLLKAGNLIKGGFTSLSINSIIDIISPLKTGEFSDIYGVIRIKDGIARNFELTSKGKNLNLFIAGTYNFSTSIANMQVFGLLSKKLSTIFGPIGNFSINTLFNIIPGIDLSKDSLILDKINKIPGIEFSNKAYRKFVADIKGNINNDDYVTSFQWIN